MSATIIDRPRRLAQLADALQRSPIVAILGPRQCGKTTLARTFADQRATVFDLERSADRQALATAPEHTLADLEGLVIIDEVQTMPALFPVLRVLADRPHRKTRFVLLGSASPDLVQGASESLAGRVAFIHLTGLDVAEVGADQATKLWQRGSFPRSLLAQNDDASYRWRHDFIDSFLVRDARQLGITLAPEALRRFWTMLAHLHGGALNAAALARAFSIDHKTANRYVDILAGAFLVRRLPPWFENVGKRTIKSPKIYVRDSGIVHALLGLRTATEIRSHPRMGTSWEGFAVEQVIGSADAERDAYFWGTQAGAELDLLMVRGGKKYGFEFKHADAPGTTKSMRIALADLKLERLFVVYPGSRRFDLDERITALPLTDVAGVAGAL